MDKKPFRWEDFLVVGKYYHVKYKYKGKEVEDGGTYKEFCFGLLYFKCDKGDWILVKPFDMISATTS